MYSTLRVLFFLAPFCRSLLLHSADRCFASHTGFFCQAPIAMRTPQQAPCVAAAFFIPCFWHIFCLCHTSCVVSHSLHQVSVRFRLFFNTCCNLTRYYCRIYKAMNSSNILQPVSQGSKQQNENRYIAVRMQSK